MLSNLEGRRQSTKEGAAPLTTGENMHFLEFELGGGQCF